MARAGRRPAARGDDPGARAAADARLRARAARTPTRTSSSRSRGTSTGFPVAALPAGLGARSGLPVGVSLIGPRGAEADVVQAGIDLQEHALAPPVVPYATP